MNRRGRERREYWRGHFSVLKAERFLNKLINICTVVIAYEASPNDDVLARNARRATRRMQSDSRLRKPIYTDRLCPVVATDH